MTNCTFFILLLSFTIFSCTNNEVKDKDYVAQVKKDFIKPEFSLTIETNPLNPLAGIERMFGIWNKEAAKNAAEEGEDSVEVVRVKDTLKEKNRTLNLEVPFMFYNDKKNFEEVIRNVSSSYSKWKPPTDIETKYIDSLKSFDFDGYGVLIVTYSARSYVTNSLEILKRNNNHMYLELISRASAGNNSYDKNWTSEIYKISNQNADSLTIYFEDDDLQKDSLQYALKKK